MQLFSINTGFFKLDGGAMFGVVPKTIWQRLNAADENNLCTWAMRSLLIKDGKRVILIDTGCGNKQDASFFKHYYLHPDYTLEKSLQAAGFTPDSITDVIITHLHFDHVGGATKWNDERTKVVPTFKNATYWVHKSQWFWASYPNSREAASFLKENFKPLEEAVQLKYIQRDTDFGHPAFSFLVVNGHTEGMLIPKIKLGNTTVCFMADLIPSVGHIPIPYVMSYDVRPLEAMKEKESFLKQALEQNWILFFEHDPEVECATLMLTEKGIRADKKCALMEALNILV